MAPAAGSVGAVEGRRRREQELEARFQAWLAARPDQRDRYEAASTQLAEHVKQPLGFAMDGASAYVHLDMDTDELHGPWLRMLAVREAWQRDEAGS